MSTTTKNLGLIKPDNGDRYTPEVLNKNVEKIESHLNKIGSDRGNYTSGTISINIDAEPGFTVTAIRARRMFTVGYVRFLFNAANEMTTTSTGALVGGPKRIATLKREQRPRAKTGFQSGEAGTYQIEGIIDEGGGIYLTHIHTRTRVPENTALQGIAGWYTLRGDS